jgi:hypothetical protein
LKSESRHPSSFRDPSGFVFRRDGEIYRQINPVYRDSYELLMSSGLYRSLVDDRLMVAHERVDPAEVAGDGTGYRIVRPEPVRFLSYPYEWCFSELRDAALLTLDIQVRALDHGLSLKDASAYNIQFSSGRPIFIDTLSFEPCAKERPWVAYQQFCKHFLGPLALMVYKHVDLRRLLQVYIDGIPLDMTSRLLPGWTRLSFSLLTHIHMHASSVRRYQNTDADAEIGSRLRQSKGISEIGLRGLLDNLRALVSGLEWKPRGTEWGDYYDATNYSDAAQKSKGDLVAKLIEKVNPANVWDLGANTGVFSRIASSRGIPTVAFDLDPTAVEKNYRTMRAAGETNLLPLIMDLTSPSPDLGWNFCERTSLAGRGPAELTMALALIHHLAISNNVPLWMLADFFRGLSRTLLIEWVPKSDSQVKRLLASREDVFPDYRQDAFEAAFGRVFTLREKIPVEDSERTLYLYE